MKKAGNVFSCLLAIVFVMNVLLAHGQLANQTKIDVDFKDIPLKEALDQIQRKTNFNFIYSEEMVVAHRVTLSAKDMAVADILENMLSLAGLSFVQRETKLIITKKAVDAQTVTKPTSVPMMGMTSTQVARIKGKVLDRGDVPIPGVTVVFKENRATATQTDINGDYIIVVPTNASTLVFSSIGYVPKEIKPGSATEINVMLEQDDNTLESVVVTGVFTRRAESFTGSAATFNAEDLRTVGNQNVIQSLKMLDPSFVQIENVELGSNPNVLPDLQVRGANSLPDIRGEYAGSPNMPLFILDGFESDLQKIYDLDINRVASVTILKDAPAKAIYGSRAANGVIVVETKRPEMGKLRLSYTGDFNITAPDLTSYQLAGAAEKLQVELNAGRYSSSYYYNDQLLKEEYNRLYTEVARGVNTDWLAQPVKTAAGHKHTLMLEGGDPHLRYGADFTFNEIAGVMKESGRRTVSGNVYLSYRVDNFLFRNNLMVTGNHANDSPYGSFSAYSRLNPYWTPYEENGSLKKVVGQFSSGAGTPINYFNPLYDANLGTKNFSNYTDIMNNFQAEWSIMDNLKVIGRFGYTHTTNKREDFYPANHTRFAEYAAEDFFRRGQYSITNGTATSIKSDITLNYSKLLGKHLVFLNAGWNLYETKSENHGMQAEGFLNDRVDNINFARQYMQDGRPTGTDALTRETGLLSALNYSFDERYLVDLTFRRQGSSVFGLDNRWGNFWSAGIGWNLHREVFLNNQSWLDQFRLRASTGYTGSQNFNPYQAMATYNYFTDVYYDNIVGARLMGLANDELKWQQTQDYNFGADVHLWQRFTLRFDYYISTTNNLLTDLPLPGSVGFNTIKENLGEVRNTGVDAVMSLRVFHAPSTNSFLNFFLNVGANRNRLMKISDALNSLNDELEEERGESTRPFVRYREGESTSALWAVPSQGIDPITGSEIFRTANGELTYVWNPNDQVVVGDTNPKLRGSFGINAQHRGWGFNCGFIYRIGGQYYNQTLVDRVENVDIQYNVDRRVFTDTWTAPGDEVLYKRISAVPTRTNPTSRFVQDLYELQLGSVNVSYDFMNTSFLERTGMQRLRVTAFSNDIARLSNIRAERGLDFPFARTFSLSVQATF
ncbi:SusC/RagA family TonB-linked outer membrane protein [Parapedobacter deserti]|uniref:SusC/RagA family TonB-linked outer membrane protein n=1 Tax=Parapedobacter deserti TaxID=1912957 RepID=A0ABV7JDC4_9SPHI